MKRILAALLAVMLVMSASLTAFGATQKDVEEKINSSFAYADKEYSQKGYTVNSNLKEFYVLTCAEADVSKYEQTFLESVKEALDSNSFTAIDSISLVICAMLNIGADVTDFDGYNLIEILKSIPVDSCANPYSYTFAIQAANAVSENDCKNAFAEKLAQYYTIGKGTDFWGGYGTSPDDLSMFILGMSLADGDYSEIISDALQLLESYYTEDGYTNYGTANTDSTALALAVYSCLNVKDKADKIYDILINNFYDASTGGFKADYDPYYATMDAVYGLSFYAIVADEDTPQSEDKKPTASETENTDKNETTNEKKKSNKNTSEKSPNTGASALSAALALSLSAGVIAALKKKENN